MKADAAALEIRRAIRQGVLTPGEDLNQEQVAAKLVPIRNDNW